ncbi:hypothetical protein [Paenibacillus sp. FSL W7-1287]|uniref:hypothetical protein n=1 Tax=Paenibacillus sp. FSL W7-1287 TaxID=2954538 RepID=UPI0030F8F0BF
MESLHDALIKRHLAPLLLMCGVFVVGISVLIMNWIEPKDTYPIAIKGELDATGWDFSQQGVIPLAGNGNSTLMSCSSLIILLNQRLDQCNG